MRNLTRVVLLGLSVSAFALAGCSTTESSESSATGADAPAAAMSASNTVCPMSGEDVDPSVKTVSFQGKEIGFCCNSCRAKFVAMSDAEKAKALGG